MLQYMQDRRLRSEFTLQSAEAYSEPFQTSEGVLRNFAKFTGKYLCQSLLFSKVASLRPATLLKKRLWHRSFPVNFAKFLRTPSFTEQLRWLLLKRLSKGIVSLEVAIFTKIFMLDV